MTLTPRSREDASMEVQDPQLLIVIEKAIKGSDLPPKKTELRKALRKHPVTTREFEKALNHLEAAGKILIDKEGRTVWVAIDNPKLRKLVDSSVRLR